MEKGKEIMEIIVWGGGIPSFLRDHLFVTTRVAVRDGNFLIGAPFVSDRPRHFFFPTQQIGFGAGGRFWTFSDIVSNI